MGEERLLFICKGACELPERLATGREICLLEDYEACQDITRYDLVVIGHLSTAQLSDLALGRMSDPASCAILHALLAGIDVYLLDGALSYRKYEGKGSPALFKQLVEYEHKLQTYGIKLYVDRSVPRVPYVKAPKYGAPAVLPEIREAYIPPRIRRGTALPNADRLITEADAVSMVASLLPGETAIRLDEGAILTPSARDVFIRSRIEVI